MKKRKVGRTLSRTKDQKLALLRTLFVSLIKHKRIETTLTKAKELRPFAEKLITKARNDEKGKQDVATIRILKKNLPLVAIQELLRTSKLTKNRKGGYLRIVRSQKRGSDNVQMAFVEWVDEIHASPKSDKKSPKETAGNKKSAQKKGSEKNSKTTPAKKKEN